MVPRGVWTPDRSPSRRRRNARMNYRGPSVEKLLAGQRTPAEGLPPNTTGDNLPPKAY